MECAHLVPNQIMIIIMIMIIIIIIVIFVIIFIIIILALTLRAQNLSVKWVRWCVRLNAENIISEDYFSRAIWRS